MNRVASLYILPEVTQNGRYFYPKREWDKIISERFISGKATLPPGKAGVSCHTDDLIGAD